MWGCEKKTLMARPTMIDYENGIRINYWSCPINFVPDSIWSFIRNRNFYELHPSSPFPKIQNVSPRYLQAESVLERELTLAREEALKEGDSK